MVNIWGVTLIIGNHLGMFVAYNRTLVSESWTNYSWTADSGLFHSTKEVNQGPAKPPLNINGGLAKLWYTSIVK